MAYDTLKDPMSRASFLLKQKGITIDENSGSDCSPALLMEEMERRESIEEANDVSEYDRLYKENAKQLQDVEGELESAFAKDDMATVKNCVIKMRFIRSALNELHGLRSAQ